MGFTTGFTGGVTVTLSLAYLTVLTHRRHREHQASLLRSQTQAITGLYDPLPPTLPPTRLELAIAERANLVEHAKDRWNSEVEHAVRWTQHQDWDEVREGVETAASRLWQRVFPQSPEDQARAAERRAEAAAKAAKDAASRGSAGAEDAAASAGSSLTGWVGRGIERGRQVVGKVQEAAGGVKDAATGAVEKNSNNKSSVERALEERYQKTGDDNDKRSQEELLAARYASLNQKA